MQAIEIVGLLYRLRQQKQRGHGKTDA